MSTLSFDIDVKLPLSKEEGTVVIKPGDFHEPIRIDNTFYRVKWVRFPRNNFYKNFSIQEVDLGIGIEFSECIFFGSVNFINIQASGYDDSFNKESRSIIFKNCTFEKHVLIKGPSTSLERDLYFENCEFKKGVSLKHFSVSVQGIYFIKSSIREQLDIEFLDIKQSLRFSECVVDCRLRLNNVKASDMILLKTTFNKDIYAWGGYLERGLTINYGEFHGEVKFRCIESPGTLFITGGIFNDAVFIDYKDKSGDHSQGFNELVFVEAEYKNGLYVNGKDEIFTDPPSVRKLEIRISPKLKGELVFRHIKLELLEIEGYNSTANLVFEELSINKIKIQNFINQSMLIFSGIKAVSNENSGIAISSSNLGKAQFYRFDFDTFKKVLIHDTILSEISTSNVRWFSPGKLQLFDEEAYRNAMKRQKGNREVIESAKSTLEIHYQSVKEIYRQLKYAMDKQGDKPQALEFLRWEMENYRKLLKVSGRRNNSDKFILWSSRSNDYGLNWIKAFWWLIGLSFLFYIPIAFFGSPNLDYSQWADSWTDVCINLREVFYCRLKYWPQLLNPAHNLSNMIPFIERSPGIIYFFDFIHRLITAYFIFQIVFAFRKYVR